MILLNKKSILDCNENEREIHNKEIQNTIEKILGYKDYQCALLCKYQDEAHKDIEQRVDSCLVSELYEYLETRDIKNGVDLFTDGQYFIFLIFGQDYILNDNGQHFSVTEAIKVMPFINKEFYNVVNVLNNIAPTKIE